MTTHAIDSLNAWSPAWAEAMSRGLIEGTATLLVIGLIRLAARRRMSAGFAHGLFLLVLVRSAASTVSPWAVAVPIPALQVGEAPAVVLRSNVSAPVSLPKPPIDSPPRDEPIQPFAISNVPPMTPPIAAEASPRLSRTSWLMLLWGIVVAGLLTRFAGCGIRAGRRIALADEVDPADLPVDPDRLAAMAGLRRRVPLLHTNLVHAPAVWGLLRPRVLIPDGMLTGLPREQVTWVLLHEFAHIARKDLWVAFAQRIIQIFFFFHPAVWAANRLADIQREYACDESAFALADVSRRDCGEGFLTIAERALLGRTTAVPVVLELFGSSGVIRKRLERLLDETRKPSAGLSRPALAVLVAGALLAATRVQAQAPAPAERAVATDPPKAEITPKTESDERSMEITVVDSRTRKPMPGVTLTTSWYDEQKRGTTDASGRHRVMIPKGTLIYLSVEASKDGFATMAIHWNAQIAEGEPLPEKYTFAMEPGKTIGGLIRDEGGKPIAGAIVSMFVYSPRRGGDNFECSTSTDASGRWTYDRIPSDATDIQFDLAHPDFANGPVHDDPAPQQRMAQLRNGSRVMVMKKGIPVSGVVRDAEGRPIAGAQAILETGSVVTGNPKTTTDARGGFRFPPLPQGDAVVVIQAKGHAPDLREIKVDRLLTPLSFTLGPPHSIHGRVVDPDGKPLPGARIQVDRWRGYRRALIVDVLADAEGKFRVDDMPESPVEYRFNKDGMMHLPNVALSPSDRDVLITMNRPLVISGTVTDAETGKSIDDFTLYHGSVPGGQAFWDRERPRRFREGRFLVNDPWPVPNAKGLRVEAEGYLPADSRPFAITEGTVTYNFRLKKGKISTRPAISGVVLLPDGKTAAGAEVALASRSFGPYVRNGRDLHGKSHPRTVTEADGAFTFPPQAEECFVMIFHDQGYVESTEAALAAAPSRTLKLRKWGRVEGTLRVGTKPAEGERIVLEPDRSIPDWMNNIYFSYQATTDRMGRFVFEHVLPGKARIARSIRSSPNSRMACNFLSVEVEPGATAGIRIGGTGRPVIGRFTKPAESDFTIDWKLTRRWLRLKDRRNEPMAYAIHIEDDGSFRIEDVSSGTYELSLTIVDRYANDRKPLAEVERTVVVPEMEGGQSVEPLDLGAIEMKPIP